MKDLKKISLVVMDVDGTLTDGGVYIGKDGETFKRFDIKDGLLINLCGKKGIDFMILTGRESDSVRRRAKELNIKYVFQGVSDKKTFLSEFMEKEGYGWENLAYIGDDLNDYQAMSLVGFKACPADAADEIAEFCDYKSAKCAGHGAVRDILTYMLKSREEWNSSVLEFYGVEKK